MYKFDMNTDPYVRRQDYSWNHPSMEGVAPMNCDAAVWAILDSEKTLEEQLAVQKVFIETLANSLTPLDDETRELLDINVMYVPGLNPEDPEIRCLVVKPKKMPRGKRPGVVHLMGGGMIMGTPESNLVEISRYCLDHKCVVVSVDYRLMPKYTYPCAVDDVEAVVNYILANQDEMKIDPEKMVVCGQSAGGYLAACAAQRLKMRGGYQFAGQVLIYPVIDDMFCYPSSNIYYGEVWHPFDDQRVFEYLLGKDYNRSAAPVDAIPSHCKDFTGLPPTVLVSGDLDYGHDPVIAYAQGIMNAGIYCDLFVYGGCFHGFLGMAIGTDIADRALRNVSEAMGDLMTGKCSRK